MKRLRIKVTGIELDALRDAASRFNEAHGYLDKIDVSELNGHYTLLVAPAETAMFVESYLGELSELFRAKIRQDLIVALENLLKNESTNMPALHSLKVLVIPPKIKGLQK